MTDRFLGGVRNGIDSSPSAASLEGSSPVTSAALLLALRSRPSKRNSHFSTTRPTKAQRVPAGMGSLGGGSGPLCRTQKTIPDAANPPLQRGV